MRFGIYFAYWESEWKADYKAYIEKAARLGFDVMELSYAPMPEFSQAYMRELRACAPGQRHRADGGLRPRGQPKFVLSGPPNRQKRQGLLSEMLKRLELMGIRSIGGGLYSYWPVDFSQPVDKARDWAAGVKNVREGGPGRPRTGAWIFAWSA